MPEVGDAEYMLGYIEDLGWVSANGMGRVPLSCQEIACWENGMGYALVPWEFSALRQMSRAYLAQSHESEAPECPPPYGNPVDEIDREVVSKKVGNAFKSLMKARRPQ